MGAEKKKHPDTKINVKMPICDASSLLACMCLTMAVSAQCQWSPERERERERERGKEQEREREREREKERENTEEYAVLIYGVIQLSGGYVSTEPRPRFPPRWAVISAVLLGNDPCGAHQPNCLWTPGTGKNRRGRESLINKRLTVK